MAQPISLTYKGKRHLETEFGGVMTLLTVLIILIISATTIQSILFGYSTAEFFTTKTIYDVDSLLDLKQLGFGFAVNEIDPKIGRIEVNAVYWPHGGEKVRTKIPMINC